MKKSTICPILSLSKHISEYMGTNNKQKGEQYDI